MPGKNNTVLSRADFSRKNLDAVHYYYSFMSNKFEICLEPCAAGFDVAVYTDDRSDGIFRSKNIASEDKRCTETGDYLTSAQALFGERKDGDWNKAIEIANEIYRRILIPHAR